MRNFWLIISGALAVAGCAPSDPCADTAFNRDIVLFASETAIKPLLRSPGSAKFPTSSTGDGVIVHRFGECRFLVSSYVDSQNAFGALLRNTYSLYVTPQGNSRYVFEEINISKN